MNVRKQQRRRRTAMMNYAEMTNGQILSAALVELAQTSLECVNHAAHTNGAERNRWLDDAIAITLGLDTLIKALNLPSEHMEADFWTWLNDSEDAIWESVGQ